MKQTQIEGTEPKKMPSATELAERAERKAREYRRKAVYAKRADLNKLKLEIARALDGSPGEQLFDIHDALLDAQNALDTLVDGLSRN